MHFEDNVFFHYLYATRQYSKAGFYEQEIFTDSFLSRRRGRFLIDGAGHGDKAVEKQYDRQGMENRRGD